MSLKKKAFGLLDEAVSVARENIQGLRQGTLDIQESHARRMNAVLLKGAARDYPRTALDILRLKAAKAARKAANA